MIFQKPLSWWHSSWAQPILTSYTIIPQKLMFRFTVQRSYDFKNTPNFSTLSSASLDENYFCLSSTHFLSNSPQLSGPLNRFNSISKKCKYLSSFPWADLDVLRGELNVICKAFSFPLLLELPSSLFRLWILLRITEKLIL